MESGTVAGTVRKVVAHCRVHFAADALEVDDLGVGVVGQHGRQAAVAAAGPVVALVEIVAAAAAVGRAVDSYQGSARVDREGRVTGRASWHPVVEGDTAAGSPSAAGCRDGVVEPIPAAGVHRTTAAVARKADVAVGPVGLVVAPDPEVEVSAAAAVDSDRNCWDSDVGRRAVEAADAIAVRSLGSE